MLTIHQYSIHSLEAVDFNEWYAGRSQTIHTELKINRKMMYSSIYLFLL
jgi:hypothetical protein